MWATLIPKQGVYRHIKDTLQVGETHQTLLKMERTHYVEAISMCGDEMRKWELNSPDKILRFHHYLLRHVGVDDLRIRVRIMDKTARTRMLRHAK